MTKRDLELTQELFSDVSPKGAGGSARETKIDRRVSERWPTEAEETWLVRRVGLSVSGLYVNAGTSTPETRRERIRQAIVDGGRADVRAGYRAGEPETFAQLFERLYGVPL